MGWPAEVAPLYLAAAPPGKTTRRCLAVRRGVCLVSGQRCASVVRPPRHIRGRARGGPGRRRLPADPRLLLLERRLPEPVPDREPRSSALRAASPRRPPARDPQHALPPQPSGVRAVGAGLLRARAPDARRERVAAVRRHPARHRERRPRRLRGGALGHVPAARRHARLVRGLRPGPCRAGAARARRAVDGRDGAPVALAARRLAGAAPARRHLVRGRARPRDGRPDRARAPAARDGAARVPRRRPHRGRARRARALSADDRAGRTPWRGDDDRVSPRAGAGAQLLADHPDDARRPRRVRAHGTRRRLRVPRRAAARGARATRRRRARGRRRLAAGVRRARHAALATGDAPTGSRHVRHGRARPRPPLRRRQAGARREPAPLPLRGHDPARRGALPRARTRRRVASRAPPGTRAPLGMGRRDAGAPCRVGQLHRPPSGGASRYPARRRLGPRRRGRRAAGRDGPHPLPPVPRHRAADRERLRRLSRMGPPSSRSHFRRTRSTAVRSASSPARRWSRRPPTDAAPPDSWWRSRRRRRQGSAHPTSVGRNAKRTSCSPAGTGTPRKSTLARTMGTGAWSTVAVQPG
jgi:hypothetical protein